MANNKKISGEGYKEAKELKEMYLRLKEMAARLVELEELHPKARHFRGIIDHAISEMDNVAHLIDQEVGEVLVIERRKNPRVHKNLPIKIKYGDIDIITETRDISCSGTFCSVDQELPLMTKVQVLVMLPCFWSEPLRSKKVKCEGVVVRSERTATQRYNIGIVFTDIKRNDQAKICEYVEHALKGKC